MPRAGSTCCRRRRGEVRCRAGEPRRRERGGLRDRHGLGERAGEPTPERRCRCRLMVAVERRGTASSAESASPAGAAGLPISVALAVLFATVSSSNTASTAKATSGSSATPTMPDEQPIAKSPPRVAPARKSPAADPHGVSPDPALAANIPISPSTTPVPLYGRGTMHARVCSALPPEPSSRKPVALVRCRRSPSWPSCSPAARPSPPAKSPTSAPGGTAAQGGTLTVGVWQAPTTLLDDGISGEPALRGRDRGARRGRAALVSVDGRDMRPRPLRRTTGALTSRPRSRPLPTAVSRPAAAPTPRRRCA